MPINDINGVAWSNINDVNGVAAANIADINGVDAPSSALLLDTYSGAVAAYSTRRLNSSYTGACMRVRRSSDSVETDIGFDSSGYLDTAAIASHCSSSIGYVTKWYSQDTSGGTGSGNDAVQATASQQPRIYSGSAIYTDGGKACLYNQNVENGTVGLDVSSNVRSTNGPSSVFIVFNVDQQYTSTFQNLYSLYRTQRFVVGRTTSTAIYRDYSIGDAKGVSADRRYYKFESSEVTNQVVLSSLYDGTSEQTTSGYTSPLIELGENGTQLTGIHVTTGGSGGFRVPASGENSIMYRVGGNTQGVDGTIQEFIVYDTDESADRSDIEDNIQTYFGIT